MIISLNFNSLYNFAEYIYIYIFNSLILFQLIEIISRRFFFLSPYSLQLDLIFWLLSEYTFRLHTFSGYPYLRLLLVVDRLVVFES